MIKSKIIKMLSKKTGINDIFCDEELKFNQFSENISIHFNPQIVDIDISVLSYDTNDTDDLFKKYTPIRDLLNENWEYINIKEYDDFYRKFKLVYLKDRNIIISDFNIFHHIINDSVIISIINEISKKLKDIKFPILKKENFENFMKIFKIKKIFEDNIDKINESINNNKSKIMNYISNLMIPNEKNIYKEIENITLLLEEKYDKFNEDIEKVKKLKFVEKIEFSNHFLFLELKDLEYLTIDGTKKVSIPNLLISIINIDSDDINNDNKNIGIVLSENQNGKKLENIRDKDYINFISPSIRENNIKTNSNFLIILNLLLKNEFKKLTLFFKELIISNNPDNFFISEEEWIKNIDKSRIEEVKNE